MNHATHISLLTGAEPVAEAAAERHEARLPVRGNVCGQRAIRNRNAVALAACVIAIVVPAIPLLVLQGIGVATADAPNHIRWLHHFCEGLRSGHVAPTWAGDTFAGFGSHPWEVYGRVAYYLLAPWALLAGDAWTGLRIGLVCLFVLGAVTSYRAGRLFFDRRDSLLLAALYVVGPYTVFVPYSQFSVGEHAAMMLIPWVFARLVRLVRSPSPARWAWFAVAYATIILTHLIAAFVTGGLLVVATWGVASRGARLASLGRTVSAVAFSLALTAFYWPFVAIADGAATRQAYEAVYHAYGQFIFASGGWKLPTLNIPIVFGITVLAATMFGCSRHAGRAIPPKLKGMWWAVVALVAGVLLIQSPLAKPLWDASALLRRIQHPYRFNAALQLPVAILLIGALVSLRRRNHDESAPRNGSRRRAWSACWCAVCGMYVALGVGTPWYLYYAAGHTAQSWPPYAEQARQADLAYLAPPTAKPDLVMRREIDSVWQVRGPGVRELHVDRWAPHDRRFVIDGNGGTVDLRTFYAPGWRLGIDGRRVEIRPGKPYGQIRFDIPAGNHQCRLQYAGIFRGRGGDLVSIAAWFVLAVTLSTRVVYRRRRTRLHRPDVTATD